MMPAGGQTGALPPSGGLNMEYRSLHTSIHTFYFSMDTDWIIDFTGTDRSQRTAEVSLNCPVVVYSNRKTIGVLIS